MRRIVILGCAGSGKSTLARQLGQHVGLTVSHLDMLFWRPGWQEPDALEFRANIAAATSGEGWISEGNYITRTFDIRLPRADTVIILERRRWLCLFRVLWRTLSGRPRPDLPEGCAERLAWALVKFVWRFNRITRPRIEAARMAYGPDLPVIRLRSERDINAFLVNLP